MLRDSNLKIKFFRNILSNLYVPKFFHDKIQTNFLKDLKFVEVKEPENNTFFSKSKSIGRRLYPYIAEDRSDVFYSTHRFNFPFPEKYLEDFTYTVSGFSFNVNGTNKIKEKLNPSANLINFETNTESEPNTISDEIFYPVLKYLKEKIAEYKAIPTRNFINESYFLYDKSNLIKKTFVSAIKKQLSLYGSFSYFSENTSAKILKLIETSDFLKFFIEKKKALKDDLQLHLAYVNGSNLETTDKKIHNFSITKLGKRRRIMTLEPVDTIIIKAQQDFDIDGGLNPAEIQIRDDTILNQLKKIQKCSL